MSFISSMPLKKGRTASMRWDAWKEIVTILEAIGIGGERAQMYNLSSSEGPRFAQIAVEMDERIRKLGPNPIKLAKNKAA
jgi:coenzyme F420-reducing hydrogenase delta subunit